MHLELNFFGFGFKRKKWIDNPNLILTLDYQSQLSPLKWFSIRIEQSSSTLCTHTHTMYSRECDLRKWLKICGFDSHPEQQKIFKNTFCHVFAFFKCSLFLMKSSGKSNLQNECLYYRTQKKLRRNESKNNYTIILKAIKNNCQRKLVYNDLHPRNPKFVAMIDRWSSGLQNGFRFRQVVSVWRWSLA